MTNPPVVDNRETDEEQFTVRIPGAAAAPTDERAEVLGGAGLPGGTEAAEAAAPAAVSLPRWARLGAALFWMALGWWLVVAVRLGVRLFDTTWAGDGFRTISSTTVADLVREVTDRGRVELLTVAAISLVATLVLLIGRSRRGLGILSLLVTTGTIALTVWHLTR